MLEAFDGFRALGDLGIPAIDFRWSPMGWLVNNSPFLGHRWRRWRKNDVRRCLGFVDILGRSGVLALFELLPR